MLASQLVTQPPLTLLCARVALLRARTSCTKLPSDFIDNLPSSIIKISRFAFLNTPLREQGIERSIQLLPYTLDNTIDSTHTSRGKLVFKEGVETIDGSTLAEEDKDCIREVVINDGVKVIGAKAFYGCEEISAVYFPRTVVEICSKAFGG